MIRRLAVALGALGLASCFQYRERATVYPDGSGKIEVSVGFLGSQEEESDFEELAKVRANIEGIAAWTEPRRRACRDCGAYRYVTATAYFEDIRRVRFYDGEGDSRKLAREFGWGERDDGGFVLEVGIPEEFRRAAGEGEWARGLLQGLLDTAEVSVSMVLPGDVREAEGLERMQRRAVRWRLRGADMAVGEVPSGFRVVCGPSRLTDEELGAWRAEFRRATGRDER